jgi:hypothetical protein
MQKSCSKCGQQFNCTNETSGCWCESVHLDTGTLSRLKEKYENCLCPDCLKSFEVENTLSVSN